MNPKFYVIDFGLKYGVCFDDGLFCKTVVTFSTEQAANEYCKKMNEASK